MTLQAHLKTTLDAGLGADVRVIGYPATLDGISGPTVMCWASDLTPASTAPNGRFEVEYTITVYTAHQSPERAEDDLSETLEAVLGVLWNSRAYLLTKATRTVSEDNKIHSWTLTVSGGIIITEA